MHTSLKRQEQRLPHRSRRNRFSTEEKRPINNRNTKIRRNRTKAVTVWSVTSVEYMVISALTATTVNFQTIDWLLRPRSKKHRLNTLTLVIISVGHTILHLTETMDITDMAEVVKDPRVSKNMETYRVLVTHWLSVKLICPLWKDV